MKRDTPSPWTMGYDVREVMISGNRSRLMYGRMGLIMKLSRDFWFDNDFEMAASSLNSKFVSTS